MNSVNIKKRVYLYGILACLVNFAILYLFNERADRDEFGFVYTPTLIKILLSLVTAVLMLVVFVYVFWPMFRLVMIDDVDYAGHQRKLLLRVVFLIISGFGLMFLILLFFNFVFSYHDTFTPVDLNFGMAMSLILVWFILQSRIIRTIGVQFGIICDALLRR